MPRDAYESTCLTVLPTSFKVLHEAITTKDFTEPDDLADYLKTVKITEKFVLIVQGKNDHYSKFLPNLVKAAKHVKEFVVFCNIYSPGIIGKEVLVYLMTYLKECHTLHYQNVDPTMEIEDIIQAMSNPSTVRILSMVADEKVLDVMAAKSSETNPIVEFIVATYCHFNIEHVKKFLQTATFAPTCTLAIKFDGLKKEVMEMLLSVGEICPNDNPRYVILKMNGKTIQINRPIGDNDAYQPLPNGEVDDGSKDDENDEVDSDDPNNYQDAE